MEDEGEGVVVGQKPIVMVPRHIKKKSLRNKGLSITFDEKNLRDFITGFQKRKDKRRKEAQKQLQNKEKKMRIEARKKRKEARESALRSQFKESELQLEQEEDSDAEEDRPSAVASVSETKIYENTSATITVTTSQLVNENEDLEPVHSMPNPSNRLEKNYKVPVRRKLMKGSASKQKLIKKVSKSASHRRDGRKNKKDKR